MASEPIKVGVNGAAGRMGKATLKGLAQAGGLETVFALDRGDDLAAAIREKQARIVIDFTVPDCVFENTLTILRNGAAPVVGTTGLSKSERDQIHQELLDRRLGGIVAPNFSLGALLMMKCSALAARYFGRSEIIEMHHEAKVDSPSGTALLTADQIAAAREKELAPGEGSPIHSVRLPGLMAHQEVIFGGEGETLRIRHDALNRDCFLPGILMAVRQVLRVEGLQVGLEI